jgi:UrcA family protein
MKTFTHLLAIAFLMTASVTQARPPGTETTSSIVSFADLNLDNPAGVAQLHARIRAAAHEVCGNADSRNLVAVSHVRNCTSRAETQAMASLDANTSARLALRSKGRR